MTNPASEKSHPTSAQDGQPVELYPPVDDDGWHSSQVRDWVAVSPELSDSAIRMYLIMRALVIEKRGPVRKLTLWELCHLLPSKPVGPGERPAPSSTSRIRGLLRQLTVIGLVTTPEGRRLTTSSRALAAGRGLRIRINLMPTTAYTGPRNVFDVLDDVREAAEQSARRARTRELELAAKKRAEKAAERAGQISDPHLPGQKSDPLGQIFDPLGQKSDPDSGPDLQDRVLPLSSPAQTSRSDVPPASVRPSVQVEIAQEARTDGRGGGIDSEKEGEPAVAGVLEVGSVSGDASAETRTQGTDAAARQRSALAENQPRVDDSPGVRLLMDVADDRLRADLLRGTAMRDQGLMVTGLLEAGHTIELLREVISQPMPHPLQRTRSAVIAGRLRKLAALPVQQPWAAVPGQASPAAPAMPVPGTQAEQGNGQRGNGTPTYAPATWQDVQREQKRQLLDACMAADGMCPSLAVIGEAMCPEHLGWERCRGFGNYSCDRRTRDGSQCPTCQEQAFYQHLADTMPNTGDGTCPGHNGPCGKPVVTLGMCRNCRFAAEADRDRLEQEWRASLAEAVAAAESQEAQEATHTPS
ncbi:hypothetical protein EDD95_8160 [Streptomyces sp. CEV 2-1]|uniref:hypothetical protein n=1 Tax=Streptomyces sp. CEV 2-1 TaxID=2485153 RepID=UPI000F4760D3|nr:hypothetical protein [Streptomyces sp. CEV 2-1]ROQ65297.1 hypothetical protein EDD95_8160 [Streptomyces sp. CEV 2-1]